MNTNEPQNPDQNPRNADRSPSDPDFTETARLPETGEFGGGATAPDAGTGAVPGAAAPNPAPGVDPGVDPSAIGAGAAGAAGAVPPGGPRDGSGADAGRTQARRNRPWLIAAGIAAAVLLLGGGGIAIGAALAGDDRDDAARSSSERGAFDDRDDDLAGPTAEPDGNRDDDGREGGSGSSSSDPAAGGDSAPADARSLADAIDVAIAEVSGEGATSIEVERGGWDVDVRLADGTEVEVRVAEDGAAAVRDQDDDRDDRDRDPLLDTSKLSDIIDAALEAAGGGRIESISTDDDRVRYDVSVDLGNGEDVDVELDEKLAVLEVD